MSAFAVSPPPPIVNGDLTSDYEQVLFVYVEGRSGAGACTGSLINDEWVLTASHCISRISLGFDPTSVSVYVGSDTNSFSQGLYADEWYAHPDYNGTDGYNDVALLHLDGTFRNVDLMPVAQTSIKRTEVGTDFRMVGFGATSDNDSSSVMRKRTATVPLDQYDDMLMVTYDTADQENACHGDSGGPVLRELSAGGFEVVGVMDFVFGNNADCEGNGLASARVDYFIDWFERYTDVFTYDELNGDADTDTDSDTDSDTDADTDTDADGDSDADTDRNDDGIEDPKRPAEVGEDYPADSGLCATAPGAGGSLLALGLAIAGLRRRQSA